MAEATPFLPGLSSIGSKSLTAAQDAGNLTSNGGLVVLREAARRLGLAALIADPLPDTRNPLLVVHSYRAMVTARMMAIAAGYEDGDDLDALRHDPALLIACERAPESGHDIPSQPTISRLENLADAGTLYRIGSGFIDLFCRSYARVPASIVLDIDDTDDLVHGQQELALFNTHAGGHCFQPIHIFEASSGKPILSLLRPGKRPSGEEIARVLRHVIHRIRRHWPQVDILVRGDGHYCAPEVLNLLRAKRCDYILGLARNKTLDALAGLTPVWWTGEYYRSSDLMWILLFLASTFVCAPCGARTFVPAHSSDTPARAGPVKIGRRAYVSIRRDISRPHLEGA
jgi:hypothetical protein